MSISEQALAKSSKPQNGVGDMPRHEQSISEQYRILGLQWADAKAAYRVRDELKSVTLSRLKNKLMGEQGQMSEAKAERLVKSSDEWEQYIRAMCADEHTADRLKVQMKSIEIHQWEVNDKNSTSRAERRF